MLVSFTHTRFLARREQAVREAALRASREGSEARRPSRRRGRKKGDGENRAHRLGWNVYLHCPDEEHDSLVTCGLSETAARGAVRRLNATLPPARLGERFAYHYCHHGSHARSARDFGLDRWIDDDTNGAGEEAVHA